MDWKNKVVVVAGADSPVGYVLCQLLKKDHANIYACGQTEEKLSHLKGIHTQVISLNDINSLKSWIDRIGAKEGQIDTVFCDTTKELPAVPVLNLEPDIVNAGMLCTTYYSWKTALYAIPYLKTTGQGSTIFITTNSHRHITKNNILAALCSTSIESMTKNFASEIAASKIRMCSVAADENTSNAYTASCAAFLASPEASYITGTMVEVKNIPSIPSAIIP